MKDYNIYMIQLNSLLIEIENNLTTDITSEMVANGYVKFYFDGFDFIFEDGGGQKYQPSLDLYIVLDEYYGTLDRDKLEINL